jgi:predicted DNA-binding protein YlxM (UPF0122 family)
MTISCSTCPDRAICRKATPEKCVKLKNQLPPPITDEDLASSHRKEMPSEALMAGFYDPSYGKGRHHKRPEEAPVIEDNAKWCSWVNEELSRGLKHLVDSLPAKRKRYIKAWMELSELGDDKPYVEIARRYKVTRQTIRTAIQKSLLTLKDAVKAKLPKHLTRDTRTGEIRPKKDSVGRRGGIPWTKIQLDYIQHNVSLLELSKKYGVSHQALMTRSADERWREGREKIQTELTEKAIHNITTQRASEVDKIDKDLMNDWHIIRAGIVGKLLVKGKDGKPKLNQKLKPSEIKTLTDTLTAYQRGVYLIIGKSCEITERKVTVSQGSNDLLIANLISMLDGIADEAFCKRLEASYDAWVEADIIDVTPKV